MDDYDIVTQEYTSPIKKQAKIRDEPFDSINIAEQPHRSP